MVGRFVRTCTGGRRWEHFVGRLLCEALPQLHRLAAGLASIAGNYASAFAQGNWIILVRRLEYHCKHLFALYASRRAAEYFRDKALRRRVRAIFATTQ